MTGDEAAGFFRNDPHAFKIYHRGYQKQVRLLRINLCLRCQWLIRCEKRDSWSFGRSRDVKFFKIYESYARF
ncbi:unnamed protein product [Gongylonema pulchrum]|uniref:Ribosomal RNA-processing protein 8 n=1 Tax=Gongylonema pulchrum TaxID=637853 RepID=A0A183F1N8_9BILA|nr:unnamed protein product [Gongylonema pulchrum]